MKIRLFKKKNKKEMINNHIKKMQSKKIKFETKPAVFFLGSRESNKMIMMNKKDPKKFDII